MTTSQPPLGTHFSDGVRTGPILGSQYTAGANSLTPATQVSGPIDYTAPGVFNTPKSLVDIIPTPVSATVIAAAQNLGAGAYLTLATANALGVSIVTYQGNSGVLQLDTPRNITMTSAANASGSTITINGWDEYGQPISENFASPNTTTTVGNKTFLYIKRIYSSAAVAQNVTVGVGNIFSLGYLVTNSNYIGIPEWGGVPDLAPTTTGQTTVGPLANNPLTSTAGSSVVTVTVTSTSALRSGQLVAIAGAATFDTTLTAASLNITAVITVVDATHFSYVANAAGTAGAAGGGAAVTYTPVAYGVAGTFVAGAQATATATTGDVRGTYTPSSNADGTKRLTIMYYNASGDNRNYIAANNGSVILNLNPLASGNATTTMTVTAPNHQYVTGELVTISGGTGTINGVTAAQYNLSNVAVTVIDANSFTYPLAVTSGGAPASGGGAAVLMAVRYGILYQSPVGRFGVTQFKNTTLF